MRRLVYSVAASLDGYIAGPDGEFDWIPHDPDIDFQARFARYDTLLMGRGTWEVTQRVGAPPMPFRSVVVSTRLQPSDVKDAELFADPVAAVEALRARPGKDIWLFGGGVLFGALANAGLVDEVEVAVVPILLGRGLPLMAGATRRLQLRLREHVPYRISGIVLMHYDVLREGVPDPR